MGIAGDDLVALGDRLIQAVELGVAPSKREREMEAEKGSAEMPCLRSSTSGQAHNVRIVNFRSDVLDIAA